MKFSQAWPKVNNFQIIYPLLGCWKNQTTNNMTQVLRSAISPCSPRWHQSVQVFTPVIVHPVGAASRPNPHRSCGIQWRYTGSSPAYIASWTVELIPAIVNQPITIVVISITTGYVRTSHLNEKGVFFWTKFPGREENLHEMNHFLRPRNKSNRKETWN